MELPGQTRVIFRACDWRVAEAYVETGKHELLFTSKAGDFHLKEPATYFSYSEEFARQYAKRRGKAGSVIKQIIPLDMLKQSGQYYNFGCVPNDEWRAVITACRREEKAQGKLLNIQKRAILEGPIADTATQNFARLPVPANKFKPAMLNGEYVLQIAFKKATIAQLALLDRQILQA
jgi:hypothetical protein